MGDEITYSDVNIRQRLQASLTNWQLVDGHIQRVYKTQGWKGAVMAFNAVAHLAETAWHHPDVHVSWGSVTVRLMTHSAKGITDKDFQLAAKIEDLLMWRPGKEENSELRGTPENDQYRYMQYD